MESSPTELFCPVRKEWVKAFPEEIVRQKLLQFLINRLGFPSPSLVVEKALHQMPHLALQPRHQLPDRRADIVSFSKGIHSEHELYPLLLIECKAVPLNQQVIQQVLGYNHHLGAAFVAIANAEETKCGWYDTEKKEHRFVSYIPSHDQLLRSIAR